MYFVWSPWYIVILFLIAAIVGATVLYFKMNKKDYKLLKDFAKSNSQEGEQKSEEKQEPQKEEKVEAHSAEVNAEEQPVEAKAEEPKE